MVIPISQWCRQAKKIKFGFQQVFADLLFARSETHSTFKKVNNNKKAILILYIFHKVARGQSSSLSPTGGQQKQMWGM